jgi:acyl carrier protein
MTPLTREEIKTVILEFCRKEFEMENPGLDDDLREVHEFDSIDAIELLLEIENLLESELTQEEKKQAMEIRTLNDVLDYIESLMKARVGGS